VIPVISALRSVIGSSLGVSIASRWGGVQLYQLDRGDGSTELPESASSVMLSNAALYTASNKQRLLSACRMPIIAVTDF
jgi:hypothetical protein